MTLSSMPVARRKWLKRAIRMASESQYEVAVVWVGRRTQDGGGAVPREREEAAAVLKEQGKLFEASSADFGALFPWMDALVVHGGLGTTVEALRAKKPVAVTGPLLMDQRFWGGVCEAHGVGPPPVHFDDFGRTCVDFVNRALDPNSAWRQNAEALEWGGREDYGIEVNVAAFEAMLDAGVKPVRTRPPAKENERPAQRTEPV